MEWRWSSLVSGRTIRLRIADHFNFSPISRAILSEFVEGKQDADSGERVAQRQKRSKQKLIRLDDLVPEKEVVGGGPLFGATGECA